MSTTVPSASASVPDAGVPARSGIFLVGPVDGDTVFVPEHFGEEERMIADTAERFVQEKVLPRLDEIDAQTPGLLPGLVREVGELGVFSIDVPEALDGLGASKKTAMRVAEALGSGGAFGPATLVQTGIGGLPIIYFGNDDQRERYLAGIMSGEIITAYALTEPGSGSDALAAKTTAVWSEDDDAYILNGTKQFITNAGFADLFITFAKIDGEQFTCFIVETAWDGVSTGAEETKMGLKGSSTRSLILEGVKVPKANILGDVGTGHRIAFNVLNIGRLKLAPAVLGGAKRTVQHGITYAQERHQFGKPLADFGLIRQKIAESVMRIYCSESMCYRTAGLIDDHIADEIGAGEGDHAQATVRALKELAVECSINKIHASETLDYVVDEMLQLHGGYGYIQEYPVERAYRDARINRIWEGTNEINRMIITGTLLRLAMKGRLPLLAEVKKITDALMARRAAPDLGDGPLALEASLIANAKKMTLFAAGVAAQKFMQKINDQQEVLAWLADMVIQTFAMESALLRTQRLAGERSDADLRAREAATRLAVEFGMTMAEQNAKMVLSTAAEGEELRSMLSMLKKLTRREPIAVVKESHVLAEFALERGGYPFA